MRALLWAVPTVLGVGLIMLTNNTCDVEKDVEAGRRTLPVLLGPRAGAGGSTTARASSRGSASIVALVGAFFPGGLLVVAPFMLLGRLAASWARC